MSDMFTAYRDELERLEQAALDEPDRLFAISYLRSHLDLISDEALTDSLPASLEQAVQSTFDADRMSEADRAEVLSLIETLHQSM